MQSDREQIIRLYHDMYAAMVRKDEDELNRIHDNSFVLIHMTGLRQSKREYIRAILDGTLNYYYEETAGVEVKISKDRAVMTGYSRVTAAVFGGGRHTWRLALRLDLKKTEDGWKLTKAQASTW